MARRDLTKGNLRDNHVRPCHPAPKSHRLAKTRSAMARLDGPILLPDPLLHSTVLNTHAAFTSAQVSPVPSESQTSSIETIISFTTPHHWIGKSVTDQVTLHHAVTATVTGQMKNAKPATAGFPPDHHPPYDLHHITSRPSLRLNQTQSKYVLTRVVKLLPHTFFPHPFPTPRPADRPHAGPPPIRSRLRGQTSSPVIHYISRSIDS
ncbi:hypothetical protein F4861DRAFT_156881 [Xylaria intraflava]|nr:hypothetical protein F4861DRAFT_156881 [Xylaria intraflava]